MGLKSIFRRLASKVLLNHKSYLEGNSVLKLAEIETCDLTDLLKSVYKSVSVYEELSRGLGYVQVVLEERLHGHKSLAIKRLERSLLEHLAEEYLAKSSRELIDKSADAELFVGHNRLFDIEHLADLEGDPCFLVGSGKILKTVNDGGDTDESLFAVLLVNTEGTTKIKYSLSSTAAFISVVNSMSFGSLTPGSLSRCSWYSFNIPISLSTIDQTVT